MKNLIITCFSFLLIIHIPVTAQDEGEFLFNSTYDYIYNNSPQHIEMIDLDNDGTVDPVIMLYGRSEVTSPRQIHLFYKESGSWNSIHLFQDGSSFCGMQYCSNGPLDGKILSMANYSGVTHFAVIDLDDWQVTTVSPGELFNSFVYLNDGSILAGRNLGIYKSSDQGSTFNHIFDIGDGDSNVDLSSAGVLPIRVSENGQHLSIVGAFDDAATTGVPDIVYNYFSNDFGATWQGNILGRGSGSHSMYGQISNRDYAPYFTNFGQFSHLVDNDGKTHVVINGYGQGVLEGSTDTTSVFPVLFWNNNNQEWIATTLAGQEAPGDAAGNLITGGTTVRTYPGNGIGNAYGSVSFSDDDQFVFTAWQGMEFLGEIGNSNWNMFPGDGGPESGVIYYTDIYYTYSTDGGSTWSTVNKLEGGEGVMEMYPLLSRKPAIDPVSGHYLVNYLYYEDAVPGVSVFNGQISGQNSSSTDGAWKYNSLQLDFGPTNVDGNNSVVENFRLEQNYPNPFNPNTVIKYQLPDAGNVTLKVYDVLGSEVATLVNEYKNAGSYEIEFNTQQATSNKQLSSGVYFYQMKAGKFVETRKMIYIR